MLTASGVEGQKQGILFYGVNGQLALPWFGRGRRNLAEFVTDFDRGLYARGDAHLYVNCGLGVTGQRIRLFTPREITVAELTPA